MTKIELIVTRHPGLVKYLQEIGLVDSETIWDWVKRNYIEEDFEAGMQDLETEQRKGELK